MSVGCYQAVIHTRVIALANRFSAFACNKRVRTCNSYHSGELLSMAHHHMVSRPPSLSTAGGNDGRGIITRTYAYSPWT